MFLSRIRIENFRNFHKLDVYLSSSTVVGENNMGKSNLLLALRLVLDPRLPDSARQLREEDFWDGRVYSNRKAGLHDFSTNRYG